MSCLYPYLISSLPQLQFGMRPPFSLGQFLERCQELIPGKDFTLLKNLPAVEEYAQKKFAHPLVEEWVSFDAALRNALARVRASRRHIDPGPYLRSDGYSAPSLELLAASSQRNPSLVEAEKELDKARWNKLEELSFGHYFDLGSLIIYAYQLKILERWEKFRSAEPAVLLEETLSSP
jgi:hypothetical protein